MTEHGDFVIALFGPDGSGKTTVAGLLEARSLAAGRQVRRLHWRPFLLPGSGVLFKREMNPAEPHGSAVRPRWLSLLLVIYYWLDFGIEALLRRFVGSRRVVILERSYHDMAFDPRRYGLKGSKWLVSLLVQALPKPDLVVILSGHAEVLAQRKPELSVEEINRQVVVMTEFFRGNPNAIVIDVTTSSPDEVVERIISNMRVRLDIVARPYAT